MLWTTEVNMLEVVLERMTEVTAEATALKAVSFESMLLETMSAEVMTLEVMAFKAMSTETMTAEAMTFDPVPEVPSERTAAPYPEAVTEAMHSEVVHPTKTMEPAKAMHSTEPMAETSRRRWCGGERG